VDLRLVWLINRCFSGWSGRGGQTIGAYNEHQNPEGSSSGSAVAASIGLAVACLGTETNGSLISPASYNHIVSIKPTAGLTSRAGAIPLSFDQE
jgi:amidase